VERSRGNGRVILDVVNRGNTVTVPNFNHRHRPVFGPDTADGNPSIRRRRRFLMRRGFTVISCGLAVRRARSCPACSGSTLPRRAPPTAGRSAAESTSTCRTPSPYPHFLLSDRGHLAHPAADLDEPNAALLVRDQLDGTP
jgi:hypothetical protein